MMSAVSASSAMQMQQMPQQQVQTLSDDQRQLISDTLENYDADTLSADDAASIVEAFKEAGIRPGGQLADAMSEAGFDAAAVGELAGVKPPKPPQGTPPTTDQLTLIAETLENYDAENLSADDAAAIIETFTEAGISPSTEMEQAIADAGFDAHTLGDIARGDSPSSSSRTITDESTLRQLDTLLNDYYSKHQSEDQRLDTRAAIEELFAQAGADQLVDISV